jgi:hypothetical protein
MMDKKLIEKYLKLYPRIDEEIKELEDDLGYYEFKKTEHEMKNQYKNRDDIIEQIENGLKQKHDVILGLIKVRDYISIALVRADTDCRKIIDLKLWKRKQWDEIGGEIGISARQAKRIYDQFFNYFKNFHVDIPEDI